MDVEKARQRLPRCLSWGVRQGGMSVNWRCGAIVLVAFRQAGLGIIKLWNFELVNVGKKHHWLCNFFKLTLCDLVHFLQIGDVSREVWRVGRARGWVFSRLDIIRDAITVSNANNMMSMSRLAGGLSDTVWPSVDRAQFEWILSLSMAAGVMG